MCDWWFNVDCDIAESLYSRNDEVAKERASFSGTGAAGLADAAGGVGGGRAGRVGRSINHIGGDSYLGSNIEERHSGGTR